MNSTDVIILVSTGCITPVTIVLRQFTHAKLIHTSYVSSLNRLQGQFKNRTHGQASLWFTLEGLFFNIPHFILLCSVRQQLLPFWTTLIRVMAHKLIPLKQGCTMSNKNFWTWHIWKICVIFLTLIVKVRFSIRR